MGLFDSLFGGGDEESEESEVDEAPEEVTWDDGASTVEVDDPWVSVLYPFPIEFDREELDGVLAGIDQPVDVLEGASGGFRVQLGDHVVRVVYAEGPPADEELDAGLLPENFPATRGHVAVEPELERPAVEPGGDTARADDVEPWEAPESAMRLLTALTRGLLGLDASGVVLNRSGGRVIPAREFEVFTDGADEGDWRAALGWIDIEAREADDEAEYLVTRGLELFGLPDIEVHFAERDERWARSRRTEAAQFAIGRMVVENRPLEVGGECRVPVGGDPDDPSIEADEERGYLPYGVEASEGRLRLEPTGAASVWERWASTGETDETALELPAYRELFRAGCVSMLGAPIGVVPLEGVEALEGIHCDLYREDEAAPVHFVSNGLGRAPRETTDGSRRVELAIRSSEGQEALVDILTNCAAGVELSGEVWGPGEVLEFEEPVHRMQAFLIAPLFEVVAGEGPPVDVWQLVPLREEEYEDLADGGGEAWLEEHGGATGLEFAERWEAVSG